MNNKRKGGTKIDGRTREGKMIRNATVKGNTAPVPVIQQTAVLLDVDVVNALRIVERVTGQTPSMILRRVIGTAPAGKLAVVNA